ncbi:MAG TPA: N-acetyltransferase [Enteractinococcus helveticum]|uniref:N-acetyltransferase n=1 Tax=Enteractinococcus helveticum TaxID=1837282 RepID=A0A921K828_9MICC|nr:N-acetyltransferase [Enteractinococcus helveticum]HJF15515.1 N-acetyltransferase [Enteractinococcus helveticum]
MQRTGHLWRTRSEYEDSADDHAGIRRVLEAAFETTAEADLVDELRHDPEHWIQRYSVLGMTAAIPDSEFETLPAAHALAHRCIVGGHPGLMLAPTGVLPQHQGEGAGTAVINAVLELAKDDGEAFVLVYGYPHYYPRFGFTPAAEAGITAQWATQKPALQIRILDDTATIPTGEVELPKAYGI